MVVIVNVSVLGNFRLSCPTPIGLMTDGVLFLFVFQFCHDLVVLFLVESV
mgnify:CR=1 FL=1